jgi:hypothetical protein
VYGCVVMLADCMQRMNEEESGWMHMHGVSPYVCDRERDRKGLGRTVD